MRHAERREDVLGQVVLERLPRHTLDDARRNRGIDVGIGDDVIAPASLRRPASGQEGTQRCARAARRHNATDPVFEPRLMTEQPSQRDGGTSRFDRHREVQIPGDILVEVNLDGTGSYDVATGIGFLDHMVEQFSRHSLIDVTLKVQGDLHVDQHHTTEDSAIALGQALAQALGDKGGISRYGTAYSPMDETLVRVALDISGRPYLVWKLRFTQEKLGEWDTELVEHWFHSVAQAAGITLHVQLLYGQNNHHLCEAAFKGFARAMRQAVELDPRKGGAVPSTKGQLGG